jgi:hypothetical protein
MNDLKYAQHSSVLDKDTLVTRSPQQGGANEVLLKDILSVLLPLCAFLIWGISLKTLDLSKMNDLGLVSILTPQIFFALILLTVSYCLALRRTPVSTPILIFHLVLLAFMLYAITSLIEDGPTYTWVYRDAGYTEYVMRNGAVAPSLDTYFNWPGLFILMAFITKMTGYTDTLAIAKWMPFFYNVIYLLPIYAILSTLTTNKKHVWLSLWFFVSANWVAQDTFVPQALDLFMYLAIMAVLLKWFKLPPAVQGRKPNRIWRLFIRISPLVGKFYDWLSAPDEVRTSIGPWKRAFLLALIVLIFFFIVYSHPLTPFFAFASAAALVIFRRAVPAWLPVVMGIMTALWIGFMTQAFLAGHSSMVFGDFGHIFSAFAVNVTDRASQGSPLHDLIAKLRIVLTLVVWGLAFIGGVIRWRNGHRDITYILLVVAPFPILIAQSYGGEMLLRIFLFTLPLMSFFIASIFYTGSGVKIPVWSTVAMIVVSLVILAGFQFARYGNERMDYKTYAELDAVRYLYNVAPANSQLFQIDDGTPWLAKNYEKYVTNTLLEPDSPVSPSIVTSRNINALVKYINTTQTPAAYVILSRSQRASTEMSGMPPDTVDRFGAALLASGKFKMIYTNHDAQIYQYIKPAK